MAAAGAGEVLSVLHLAIHPARVSFHTHLLAVCRRGPTQVWPDKGVLAHAQALGTLPSVGWKRLRSCPLNPFCYTIYSIKKQPDTSRLFFIFYLFARASTLRGSATRASSADTMRCACPGRGVQPRGIGVRNFHIARAHSRNAEHRSCGATR